MQHNVTEPDMLTTKEAIPYLRRCRHTICKMCRTKRLPHVRMPDGAYLFRRVELDKWLAERSA